MRYLTLTRWQCPNFPGRVQPSIFGEEKLNFRVRNENGWALLSIVTITCIITDCSGIINYFVVLFYKRKEKQYHHNCTFTKSRHLVLKLFQDILDQVLDLLVSVNYIHCCTSISDLSTLLSARGLTNLCYGISNLKGSFTLRCFQRLSRPYFATQPCIWRYNWCTIGTSTLVLSYQEQLLSNILRPRWIGTKLSHDVLNPAHVPL